MADDDVIREVVDLSGSRVVLLGRLWCEKVLRNHPELARHLDAVVDAVLSADHLDADPVFEERRRYYRRNAGPRSWSA